MYVYHGISPKHHELISSCAVQSRVLVDFWLDNYKVQVEARSGLLHVDIPGQISCCVVAEINLHLVTKMNRLKSVAKFAKLRTSTLMTSVAILLAIGMIPAWEWRWEWGLVVQTFCYLHSILVIPNYGIAQNTKTMT